MWAFVHFRQWTLHLLAYALTTYKVQEWNMQRYWMWSIKSRSIYISNCTAASSRSMDQKTILFTGEIREGYLHVLLLHLQSLLHVGEWHGFLYASLLAWTTAAAPLLQYKWGVRHVWQGMSHVYSWAARLLVATLLSTYVGLVAAWARVLEMTRLHIGRSSHYCAVFLLPFHY
jgi:hypothetical protein